MNASRFTFCVLLLGVLLAPIPLALAQSGGGYDLTWNTIDSGGTTWSTGGPYALGGTIGQPDVGQVSNLPYTLAGGFWAGATAQYRVYLPLVLRNYP